MPSFPKISGLGGYSNVMDLSKLYAKGGKVKRTPMELLQMLKVSGENIRQFSYACQKSPEIRKWFKHFLDSGLNRQEAQRVIYDHLIQTCLLAAFDDARGHVWHCNGFGSS